MGLIFTDFDKITDLIMFLSPEISLTICLILNTKNKLGGYQNFHSEYKYTNASGKTCYSIRRNIQPFFQIVDCKDYRNNIMIKAQDVVMLKMLIENNVLPWFMGSTRIYFFDDDNKLRIKGKYEFQNISMSDYSFLAFAPIILNYEDGTEKEGIRMLINSRDRFIDMQIDTFLAFYYYITTIDLYAAGANMTNYVKTAPYDVNIHGVDGGFDNGRYNQYDEDIPSKGSGGNFFNKL